MPQAHEFAVFSPEPHANDLLKAGKYDTIRRFLAD
ncbi:hypothetical protein Metme_2696 [Methylomonas methanica MC09]|uniref:Uncharacterized protein n=1 Tax=Methylomonas methanica (strain DSM 25384 / MC09) TaxID=857087 RepID=F9ZZ55_METMM|nr:hypothetical protein Metme_2696 [Methylomonas methanica MC09]